MLFRSRTFCRRSFDLYKLMIEKKVKRLPISSMMSEDLHWWLNFSKVFNGVSRIKKDVYTYPMVSDSSMKGFAVYLDLDWAAGTWTDGLCLNLNASCGHIVDPPSEFVCEENINVMELWPIVVGIKRWLHLLKGKAVLCFTDNTQVLFMLLNGTSSNKLCMKWLRELFWVCFIHDIQIYPRYISTKCNLVADTLSRLAYPKTFKDCGSLLQGCQLCCFPMILLSRTDTPTRETDSCEEECCETLYLKPEITPLGLF